ncbi:MAG TPA: glycosyltransferase family 39 protein, partial [Fimbriimonas sp.]|nr:glycosyltransferase family 39 protein [Fimbriimonas sp.]
KFAQVRRYIIRVQEEAGKRKPAISRGAAIALGVFLLALVFRLFGIGWGLKNDLHNASYHPDEPVIFGYSRQIVPIEGQFVPHFYNYGTLYLTMLRVASDFTSAYTGPPKVKGDGWSWNDPSKTDWDWVSRCDLAGRILSALAGAATALMVCLLARRFFGDAAGGIAGLFMAIAPAHVMHSRFQTVDVMATFFLTVSLYFAAKLAEPTDQETRPIWRDALWCGVYAGLSAGTKYTGILALISLFVALLIARRKGWAQALAIGVVAAFVVFFITTPGALVEFQKFKTDVSFEMQHTSTGHGLTFVGTGNGFAYNLVSLFYGVGPLLVALGVGGLAWAAYKKHKWVWVLLAFFIPYYILIGRAEVKFIRYTLPLYPVLACGFGYGMVCAHRRGGWNRGLVGLGILGAGGFPFGGLSTALAFTTRMMSEDPRDTAAKALKSQSGDVGFVAGPWFWNPPIYPDACDPNSIAIDIKRQQMRSSTPKVSVEDNGGLPEWSTALLSDVKPSSITFSSFQAFPVLRLAGTKGWPQEIQAPVDVSTAFRDQLPKQYTLESIYGSIPVGGSHPYDLPEDLLYASPIVWVWKRKP